MSSPEAIAKGIAKGTELKAQGTAHFKKQEFKEALKHYTKVFLYVNGLSSGQYQGMVPGAAPRAQPDTEQETTIKALQLSANLNCCMCHFKLGNYEKMLEFADRAIKVNPNNKKAVFRRGQAYLRLGNIDFAERDLDTAKEAFPADKSVTHEIGLLAKKLKAVEAKKRKIYANMFSNKKETTENKEAKTEA